MRASAIRRPMGMFGAYVVRPRGIVMLGDFLTQLAAWRKLLEIRNVVGLGVSRDRVACFIDRLGQVLILKPKTVFIMGGLNDLKWRRCIEKVGKLFQLFLDEIKSSQITPVVQSILLTDESPAQ